MSSTTSGTSSHLGTDERERIRRSFLFSLALTPVLLLIAPARRIVSLEATPAAIALGMSLGVVAAVGVADRTLQDVNSVMATLVALSCIGVATIVVWLVVPHQHLGAVIQFTVAFIWAMPVTELLYHRR